MNKCEKKSHTLKLFVVILKVNLNNLLTCFQVNFEINNLKIIFTS